MFNTVRKEVNFLEVVATDLDLPIIEAGDGLYKLEDDETVGCPFCGHKGCFKLYFSEDEPQDAHYHCFSCEAHGDVIQWRMKRKNVDARKAALELAEEYEVKLPNDYNPVQEIFNLAAKYYQTCMWEESTNPFPELNKKTPVEYQTSIRGHSEETLKRFGVGWSDGGLIAYLEALGFEEELLEESGLKNKKTGRDYLPRKCFIYPHVVKGRVSHFTFKDPLKKLAFQLPNKFTLNGFEFFGQDEIRDASTVYLVEGENDKLSLSDAAPGIAVLASIGQVSAAQIKWLQENCSGKDIVTFFDPDDAGNKYRNKLTKVAKSFKSMAHVVLPDEQDIDEFLKSGMTLEQALVFLQKPEIEAGPVMIPATTPPEERVSTPAKGSNDDLASRMDDVPSIEPASNAAEAELEVMDGRLENNSIIVKRGSYWKVTFNKDSDAQYKKLSNFTIKLKNIYITEDGDRHREILIVREDGYTSAPVLINSETKVSLKPFRTMLAKAADADFRGREEDLIGMWDLVYSQTPETQVMVTRTVGRHEAFKGWIFRNRFISDSGVVVEPDQDGVFWIHKGSLGIRPESLNVAATLATHKGEGRSDIPMIQTEVSTEEAEELLKGVVHNLAKNLNCPGKALMLLGWIYACVNSNTIFSLNHSFPFLFFWGTKGKGKTSIAKWLQDFFDMRNTGYTSIPQLRSAVGWGRKVEYYSSLPVFIDEVRSDRETEEYLSLFRSYYDRTPRTMGTRDGFGVRTQDVRSCFIFVGEDQFDDPATRERCIPIRIPIAGRELTESFRWMEDRKHLFGGITYKWIMENCNKDPEILKDEIRALDKKLVLEANCSQRTSKNWAAVGVFAMRLCEKYMPEFDFEAFLKDASSKEAVYQKQDSTVGQFFEIAEALMGTGREVIGPHIIRQVGDDIHVWFPGLYKAIQDDTRYKFPFSKNAVLQAIKEEPYFKEDGKKVDMGMQGWRRVVMTLDAKTVPDSIKNLIER